MLMCAIDVDLINYFYSRVKKKFCCTKSSNDFLSKFFFTTSVLGSGIHTRSQLEYQHYLFFTVNLKWLFNFMATKLAYNLL